MGCLRSCPGCGSELLQPLRWEQRPGGTIVVELRCPECNSWMEAEHSQSEMRDLDRLQSEYREELRCGYEARVAENMEELADRLRDAFERDLVGPDDFAVRRAA